MREKQFTGRANGLDNHFSWLRPGPGLIVDGFMIALGLRDIGWCGIGMQLARSALQNGIGLQTNDVKNGFLFAQFIQGWYGKTAVAAQKGRCFRKLFIIMCNNRFDEIDHTVGRIDAARTKIR